MEVLELLLDIGNRGPRVHPGKPPLRDPLGTVCGVRMPRQVVLDRLRDPVSTRLR